MSEKLDVVGIGNAMVDAIIPSNQNEIEKHNINRDSMNLIDEDLKNNLHQEYKIKEMIGGGSLGNSMFGITSFGGNGSFIGKIKDDNIGDFLQKDMIREGLQFPLGFTSPDISTGCCTIFVEEDGTRTMCTFLGAGTLISPEDIKEDQIVNHKMAYLEGYLWDNENAKKAMKKMVDICKADDQKVAFTLSDLFCVDRHRDSFSELIHNDIDILFGNFFFQYFLLTSKRARCLGNFCDLCVGDDVRDDDLLRKSVRTDALLRKRRQIDDRNRRKCAAA